MFWISSVFALIEGKFRLRIVIMCVITINIVSASVTTVKAAATKGCTMSARLSNSSGIETSSSPSAANTAELAYPTSVLFHCEPECTQQHVHCIQWLDQSPQVQGMYVSTLLPLGAVWYVAGQCHTGRD